MSNDLSDFHTANLGFDIARGNFSDCSAVNIFGFNNSLGATFETIWNDSVAYTFPASASTLSAVSDNSGDTMDVLITGLDANYVGISETVTLTGLTPVSTSKSFLRINSAVILSGANAGGISINIGATLHAFIGAGLGITQACIYTVPKDHSLYLFRITVNSATATGSQYVTIRNYTSTSTGRVLRVAEATLSSSQAEYNRQVPFKIGEKTDFLFEAKSSSSTNVVAVFVEAALVNDKPGSL